MLSYKINGVEVNTVFKDDNNTLCRSMTIEDTTIFGRPKGSHESLDIIITKPEFYAMMDAWYDSWVRDNLFN